MRLKSLSCRVLMAVHAHPDDEVIATGGLLARYSDAGVRTVVVTCTRGECGEISDPALASPEDLGDARVAEQRLAAEILGIRRTAYLGYRDSGMEGRDTNHDARSFHRAPLEEAVGRLVRLIREERPDVIITYDAMGTYGHPDHLKAHQVTRAAFLTAGDWRACPEAGPPWAPNKLYYTSPSASALERLRQRLDENGIESPFGRGGGPDIRERIARFATPDERMTTSIDVSAYADSKRAALLAHRTQFGSRSIFARLPLAATRELWAAEHLVRVVGPGPSRGETDLFAGLD